MAFASSIVWEVRTTGDETNGGGFDPTSGTPGTDYSLQDSAQVTYTDLVIDGTTNTKVTSAGNPFTSAHVGNVLNVTGGTGFTVQRVQIMSVASGAATCDKSLGTLASTGGTGKLGGALASPGKAASLVSSANNFAYIKAGTYTFSSSSNVAGGRVSNSAQWIGYSTNRNPWNTDTKPVIQPGANSMTCFDAGSNDGSMFANIQVNNPTAKTSVTAFNATFSATLFANLDVAAVATGITGGSRSRVLGCTVNGATSTGISVGGSSVLAGCTTVAGAGMATTGGDSFVFDSAVAGNGAVNTGFGAFGLAVNCTAYGCTGGAGKGVGFYNCILVVNGYAEGCDTYGFSKNGLAAQDLLVGCAGYNNTTANVNTTYYPASRQVGFQALAGSALTAPGSGDLTLNSITARGAALRAAGWPAAFPGLTPTNARDVGAYQHADPAAVGGVLVNPGMGEWQ